MLASAWKRTAGERPPACSCRVLVSGRAAWLPMEDHSVSERGDPTVRVSTVQVGTVRVGTIRAGPHWISCARARADQRAARMPYTPREARLKRRSRCRAAPRFCTKLAPARPPFAFRT